MKRRLPDQKSVSVVASIAPCCAILRMKMGRFDDDFLLSGF